MSSGLCEAGSCSAFLFFLSCCLFLSGCHQDSKNILWLFVFLCFGGNKHSCIRGEKIQKFKRFQAACAGIGFKKYSVAFCVSVFWWRQNIRAFVAKKNQRFQAAYAGEGFQKYSVAFGISVSLGRKIQKFKDSKIQKLKLEGPSPCGD